MSKWTSPFSKLVLFQSVNLSEHFSCVGPKNIFIHMLLSIVNVATKCHAAFTLECCGVDDTAYVTVLTLTKDQESKKTSSVNVSHIAFVFSREFGISCQNVSDRLVAQIKKWNGPDGCANGGEKCLYTV